MNGDDKRPVSEQFVQYPILPGQAICSCQTLFPGMKIGHFFECFPDGLINNSIPVFDQAGILIGEDCIGRYHLPNVNMFAMIVFPIIKRPGYS